MRQGELGGGSSRDAKSPSFQLTPRILVLDHDLQICEQLQRLFPIEGYRVTTAGSGEEGLASLRSGEVDLVITDMRLPGLDGASLIKQMLKICPDVPVIMITGFGDADMAVKALKLGATDFIMKPFSAQMIRDSVRAMLEKAKVVTELRRVRRSLKERFEFGGMISKKPEMHRVFETIRRVADTDMTVLVEGETGTGKELVARAIHDLSPRSAGPFMAINCAGFPDSLLESELFGHERGAFTGADQSRLGKLESAHGGTLFLDEIENMSLTMQANLLRVLEDQKVQRLGSAKWIQISMRVIAASNTPVKDLLAKGQIRQDFYYRINVVPIHLPPLRERREDIPLLIQDFLGRNRAALRKTVTGISQRVMDRVMAYSWPGNVRELHNVLERAIVMTQTQVIEKVHLPDADPSKTTPAETKRTIAAHFSLYRWLKYQEKEFLLHQLKTHRGNIGLTAEACEVDTKTLYRKMRLHGLDKQTFRG